MIAMLLSLALGVPPEGGNHRAARQLPPRDARAPATAANATITGVVVTDDAESRPVRRARVMVNGEALPLTTRTVVTSDDGTFRIAVPAGTFEVSAAKEAYVPAGARADRGGPDGVSMALAPGETKRITLRLSRGAVITGAVFDVDGQPAQGVTVAALVRRVVGPSGERRFIEVPVPVLPTDDRGVYRIYGLAAGEYLVGAQPVDSYLRGNQRPIVLMAAAPGKRILSTAQIFHPSSTDLARAEPIVVRAGEERSGIDVQLQYVPLSSISGIAAAPAGWSRAEVAMLRIAGVDRSGSSLTAYADETGRFSVSNLPAGQYRIGARSIGPLGAQSLAVADLTIDGDDADNVVLALQPSTKISGLVVFRGDTAPPVFGKSTVEPSPLALLLNGFVPFTQIQIDGVRFSIDGLLPGRFRLASVATGVRSPVGGWWLQSVTAGGVEILDQPIDLTQNIDDAVAVFSDRASEVSGRVTNADGAPVSGSAVIVFSVNRAAWFPGSRRVWGVLSDREGRYVIRNLPSGEYRLAAARGLQPFEWFDPALLEELLPTAAPLTLAGPQKTAVDLRVR